MNIKKTSIIIIAKFKKLKINLLHYNLIQTNLKQNREDKVKEINQIKSQLQTQGQLIYNNLKISKLQKRTR